MVRRQTCQQTTEVCWDKSPKRGICQNVKGFLRGGDVRSESWRVSKLSAKWAEQGRSFLMGEE